MTMTASETASPTAPLRPRDIDRHMRTLGTWVRWDQTVDTFKAGDPDVPVRGIAVAWQSQWPTLRAAHAAGCHGVASAGSWTPVT